MNKDNVYFDNTTRICAERCLENLKNKCNKHIFIRRAAILDVIIMMDYLDPWDKQKLLQMGYTIVRKLGEGSFSKVYLANYISPKEKKEFPRDQPVHLAVKLLDRKYLPENMVSYLDSEIYLLGNISHPHIIHVHSVLKRSNLYMIFMRHAEYGNLCSFLQTYGALKEKFARIWTRQLALALTYLHYLDIAHRAIKCENILVTLNNNVKLCDLGFARFIKDSSTTQALCSTFCGTLPYAAPECLAECVQHAETSVFTLPGVVDDKEGKVDGYLFCRPWKLSSYRNGEPGFVRLIQMVEIVHGKARYDGKLADIWSLGIVLYVMVNKCLPFKTENLADLWSDQVTRKFTFLSEVKAAVSPELVTVVELLLQPNPRERFSLDNLLKCKWMAMDPSLMELSAMEKLAMKQAEKVREILHSDMKVVDEDEGLFTEEDAIYRQIMEKDPCDETKEVDVFNRGTYTYDLNPFKEVKDFGIY